MLEFISTYRGVASYRVTGGPMHGKRIRVHYLAPEFYEKDWNGGYGWNYTEEQYRREIVAAAGIVDYLYMPVTPDVLEAVNKDFAASAKMSPQKHPFPFVTARYDAEEGWIKQ